MILVYNCSRSCRYKYSQMRWIIVVLVLVALAYYMQKPKVSSTQCNRRVTLRQSFHDYAVYSTLEDTPSEYTDRSLRQIASVFKCKFGDATGAKIYNCLSTYHVALRSNTGIDIASANLSSCLAASLDRDQCEISQGVDKLTDVFTANHKNKFEAIAMKSETAVRFADLLCGIVAV